MKYNNHWLWNRLQSGVLTFKNVYYIFSGWWIQIATYSKVNDCILSPKIIIDKKQTENQ